MMQFTDVIKRSFIAIIVLGSTLLSAQWIPFSSKGHGYVPEITILSEDQRSVTFDIRVHGLVSEEIDTKGMIDSRGENFALLTVPDGSHTSTVGDPRLPAIKKTIGVPYGAEIKVSIRNSEYQEVELGSIGIDKRIMPTLAPVLKMPGEKPVFAINDEIYGRDEMYPRDIVRIEGDDFMRGHRLAVLEIVPVQYNPVDNTIRYYTRIELEVTFVGGDMYRTTQEVIKDYSPVYEDFIDRRVLNANFYKNMVRDVVPLPIHYLIITHNSFQTQVNNLATWLKKKGFKVKVANQDSISSWSTTGIAAYIDAQVPEPTYLLLVGDVTGGYLPAPVGSSSGKVTDLYYAETDGTGYLPDIFYGRLSVENATHITTVVDKIIKYERADLPNMADWFKKDAFLAGNDNYSITEGTHNYCTSMFMDPHGYTTYKVYEQTYGATTADVFTNVNAGRILTTMSGHGSDDGWYDGPQFTVTHVNQLTNGDKLTIATGHCCLANNFGWTGGVCGGESWIRKANGGAVGYYGSCPSTYWSEDDWLQKEWYRAIYTDSIYEHARFTLDGMYDGVYLGSTSLKQYYYEGYHVLGDPSLDMWTEVPTAMTVTYTNVVFPGSSSFTVTVYGGSTPQENALVCAWIPAQSPEMHVAEYTNASGIATLNVAPTTPGDTMYITVTKHNFQPHEGYALVIAPSGPYLQAGSLIINDGNNGQANPGESIQLGVWAKNIGVAQANSVYGLLSTTDPYVTLVADSSWYGNIPANDSALSSPYYQFNIAANCPDAHLISFDLEFHDSLDSLWVSHPAVTVYAPIVVYERYSILTGNGVLEPGETVDLSLTLANAGGAQAGNVSATITTNDAYLTILTDSASYGTILPDSTVASQTPYVVEAGAAAPTPHLAQVVINITGTGYAAVDTFNLLIGEIGFYDSVEDTAVTNAYTVQTPWHRTQRRSYSPTYAWWNGNEGTGQYSNNIEASLVTPSITLGDDSEFECWNWYYLEANYDYGYIEISTDNGASWTQLISFNGNSGTWVRYSTVLDYPVGTQAKIRFRLSTDYSVVYEGWYVDEIRVFDPTGVREFSNLVAPEVDQFFAISPNPFRHSSQISYQLVHAGAVRLNVYDVSGRLVKSLIDGRAIQEPGDYTVTWTARDAHGRQVPAGVYFVRLDTETSTSIQKTVLLK